MVMLSINFIPVIPPQVFLSHSIVVTYKFIKRSAVPRVDFRINSRANIFGVSYESDALQNNYLKNDHTLGIPLLTLYVLKLCHQSQDKTFTDLSRRYVVELLGKQTSFPYHLTLTIFINSSI